jgi:S-adenosylmethionine:tRNA ribosyltransferase-isomerase
VETRDFSFELPEELIAQFPPEIRGTSRLLVLDRASGRTSDRSVQDFPELIPQGSLIVFNDTKVRKSRLFGETEHGGSVEFLLLNELRPGEWETVIGRRKRQKPGRRYRFAEGVEAVLLEKTDEQAIIRFEPPVDEEYLERNGAIPLPPYIRREATESDSERYQTVYSRIRGSVAAPTAGLHFTPDLLEAIGGVAEIRHVTLHVGMGTFAPIRSTTLDGHRMHTEEYEISPETAEAVNRARAEGRDLIAVGTTTVRTLESAWTGPAGVKSGRASTDLFIRPGYRFRCVDHMFTNFHTPESSLLVMVSAFAGRETILKAYTEAVEKRYRFFSYGDAMYIQ